MYKLEPNEYRELNCFRSLKDFNPTERLLRYKRTVMGLGGFVLFFIFAGINIEGFSGGFITGKLDHPKMVFFSLCIFYLYNFFMFDLVLRKEIELITFNWMNIHSFGQAIVRYIISKEISEYLQTAYEAENGPDYDYDYKLRDFTFISLPEENKLKAQFTLDPVTINLYQNKINESTDFEVDGHTVSVIYTINDEDRKYFNENRNLLRQAYMHEFMDYKFPKYFGSVVLFVILYSLGILIFRSVSFLF